MLAKMRYPALDSLRGLAALAVVFHHIALNWPAGSNTVLPRPVAYALQGVGHPSVVLFFVLSGFVLFLGYGARRDLNWKAFFVSRLFRLYPAYLFAVLISFLCIVFQGDFTKFTFDFASLSRVVTLLFVNKSDVSWNPVIWSLVYEARFSLIFPLICYWIARSRSPILPTLLILLCSALCDFALKAFGLVPDYLLTDNILYNFLITVLYMGVFAPGMYSAGLITKNSSNFTMNVYWQVAIFAFALALLIARPFFKSDIVMAVPLALILLIIVKNSYFSNILEHASFRWLGKISYSLYLIHFPVIICVPVVLKSLFNVNNGFISMPVTFCISILLAEISQRFVEAPCIEIGRYLSGIVSGRSRVGQQASKAEPL
ncbi:MAG: acyltransferase [Asticcacaulis sp.]